MSPKLETVLLACLCGGFVVGLVTFSCLRDSAAGRAARPPITVPLHP